VNSEHPFDQLTPAFVMDAVESLGFVCDGRVFALNSYENRVYQVGIEDQDPLIAKFYRPQRWSDAQILEEHAFSQELVSHELPVVAPLSRDGRSLFHHDGFVFAVFPRQGGHAPELTDPDVLLVLGRCLGRMHRVGQSQDYQHRPRLDSRSFGHDSVAYIREHCMPADLAKAYDSLAMDLLAKIDSVFACCEESVRWIRVHGDCHGGNMLWRHDAPHFVDLDDSRMAPAVQDIWMLLSGDRQEQTLQLSEIIEGYNEFADFDPRELQLVEALRTLRIMHFSAWLARRREDPAFPRAFPWFYAQRYWGDHILELREQLAALQEPALRLL